MAGFFSRRDKWQGLAVLLSVLLIVALLGLSATQKRVSVSTLSTPASVTAHVRFKNETDLSEKPIWCVRKLKEPSSAIRRLNDDLRSELRKIEHEPRVPAKSSIPRKRRRRRKKKVKSKPREEILVAVNSREFWEQGCSHSSKSELVFFHVGKGGGGTLEMLLARNKIRFQTSHPFPLQRHVSLLQTGPAKTLVINIRDPIDRFVSAFNWRLIVLCSPDDERLHGKGAAQSPHLKCKDRPVDRREEAMLREIYNSTANVMAEALCEESPSYADAKQHILGIGHAKVKLVDWLLFLIDPSQPSQVTDGGISKFMAVPMENQPGNASSLFQQHIGQLAKEIISDKYGEQLAQEIMQHKPPERDTSNEVGEKYQHSSVLFNNNTKPAPLTQLGQCCLTRHYEDDYRLIRTMLPEAFAADTTIKNIKPLPKVHPLIRTACLWGDDEQQKLCLADLRSMLLRHAIFLDRSRGTCSEIVSSMS